MVNLTGHDVRGEIPLSLYSPLLALALGVLPLSFPPLLLLLLVYVLRTEPAWFADGGYRVLMDGMSMDISVGGEGMSFRRATFYTADIFSLSASPQKVRKL